MYKCFYLLCIVVALACSGCEKATQTSYAMPKGISTLTTNLVNGIDVAEWKEEVLLFDGHTVTVGRKVTAYASGFPNSKRGRNITTEFTYAPMGITWKHEMSASSIREPIAFEIINGVAYLVLYIGDRESCQGKLPTQYLAEILKWADGKWIEVPILDFPADKALLNLYSDYWGHTAKDDAKGLVPWEGKTTGGNDNDTIKTYMDRDHRFCDFYQKS
jgi:hypothetical protein